VEVGGEEGRENRGGQKGTVPVPGNLPAEAVAVSGGGGGGGSSLDDGKNNSRESQPAENDRYDCRDEFADMFYRNPDGETMAYRCGSWDCYCCAHRMRMNLIEELERLIEERPEMCRLLTLTVGGDTGPETVEGQHRHLTDRFNALRTTLRDSYGDLSYVWIRHEGDENGRPHLHLLVDQYLPQEEISEMAERLGLGRVVDIRKVEARNAAKYLTSYLGKGTLANLPDGLRRYGSSSDISLEVRSSGNSDGDWELMKEDEVTDVPRSVVKADFIPEG